MVPDDSVEPLIEPGVSSADDTRISPPDTRRYRRSGENLVPFPAPLGNDQKPREIYSKHPKPEKEQQLKTPSPLSSPVSRVLEFRVMLWLPTGCGPCALVHSQGLSLLPSSSIIQVILPYLSSQRTVRRAKGIKALWRQKHRSQQQDIMTTP